MEIIMVYHDDQEQENKQVFSYRISEQAKYMYMNSTCYWFKGWWGGGCNYSRDDYSKVHWVIIYFYYYFIYDYSMKSSCACSIYR